MCIITTEKVGGYWETIGLYLKEECCILNHGEPWKDFKQMNVIFLCARCKLPSDCCMIIDGGGQDGCKNVQPEVFARVQEGSDSHKLG